MADKDIEDLLARQQRQKTRRSNWESLWQDLAELYLPWRADFTTQPTDGEPRTERIFDSTPMLARRGLSSALDGLLKSKTQRWFGLAPMEKGLEDDDEVKGWIDDTEERLWNAIYNPRAKFIERSAETDDDLVTFGTGILFVLEARGLNRLLFRSAHLKNVLLCEGEEGDIDTMFLDTPLTARQAAERFGRDNLGQKTREALDSNSGDKDKEFPFVEVIMPRRERDPRMRDSLNMPFASVVIDKDSVHKIGEGGYRSFPAAVPRWDTRSNETYGRSPAMLALPDSETLQQMGLTALVVGHKIAEPPVALPDDGSVDAEELVPGGEVYFDVETARTLGQIPVQTLNITGNLPTTRESQNDTRDQIWQAFFRNVLNLPIDGPTMTATEVLERKDEFLRTIGPVFGRLETNYPAVVVERAFRIMDGAGAFLPRPGPLQRRGVRFTFRSPVEQARKQIEAAGLARGMEVLAPLAQNKPEMLDHLDGDEIVRDTPETFGFPERWLKSRDRVAADRAARAQQVEEAQALEGAERLAAVAETTARTVGSEGA